MSEKVLCFPAELLKPYEKEFELAEGIVTNQLRVWSITRNIIDSDKLRYIDRDKAETDPTWKQLIPYCVLMQDTRLASEEWYTEVFAYQRTKMSGESRLHGNWSVGVGGHINPVDTDNKSSPPYYNGLWRELDEEAGLKPGQLTCPIRALIYDPSNAVGTVHFGVVHSCQVNEGVKINVSEDKLANYGYLPMSDITEVERSWENWSKLVIDKLLK